MLGRAHELVHAALWIYHNTFGDVALTNVCGELNIIMLLRSIQNKRSLPFFGLDMFLATFLQKKVFF